MVDYSILGFFLNAGVVVKGVMLLLLIASLLSWTIIFQRSATIHSIQRAAHKFEEKFWSGTDLSTLYGNLSSRRGRITGLESIFFAGFKEFARLKQHGFKPEAIMEGVHRAMRVAGSRELEKMEQSLSTLATIGSTSPYIGLFGTVWGIMTSFQALGSVQQASIAMVAPGISEALIATAMGLFAAIPAVIGYNRYMTKVEVMANQFDIFQDEFGNILYRQAHISAG